VRERAVLVRLAGVAWVLATMAGSCASKDEPRSAPSAESVPKRSPEERALTPISLPDLSHVAQSVQQQLRERHSSLKRKIESPGATTADLGNAYGEMGKLFMAAEYLDAAEACYLNAQTLMPSEMRWPYYLGHLYRKRGDPAKSAAFLERTLQLQPADVATMVWLGDVYLAQGRPEAADSVLTKALSLQPDSIALLYRLGRAALARRNYARAVEHLEKALGLGQGAVIVHYPLAMAYRELGEMEKAEAHLRQWRDVEIDPPDALMEELAGLLDSAAAYEFRGIRALDQRDGAAAAAYFRKGVALAPDSASLRHRLGTALILSGDVRGALEQFEAALRISPELARAHYSLGIIMRSNGRTQEAIKRFSTAVKYEPTYVEARFLLADALRQDGRLEESLSEYQQVIKIDPRVAEAWFECAKALVRLKRYQLARERLSEGMKVHPDQPEFAYMLARLLAAAPDDRVRDGRRAMALMQELLKTQRNIDTDETMAMTLAESGKYEEAVAWQRSAMAAARQAGRDDLLRHMAENLALYERREPCRTPWREDAMP
jgi:tetratricopeptide (TPR) repeat protein